jgi:hypothetical protein
VTVNAGGTLLRIRAGVFTALIQLTSRDFVWWAAPAVKKMEHWDKKAIVSYCRGRGWGLDRLDNQSWIEEVSSTER